MSYYYAVDNSGMATLCADLQDAIKSAKEYAGQWPKRAPYVVATMVAVDEVAAKDAEITRLREVSQAVSDSLTLYERYGEVCPFEGEPMVHASTLVALGELARAALTQQE